MTTKPTMQDLVNQLELAGSEYRARRVEAKRLKESADAARDAYESVATDRDEAEGAMMDAARISGPVAAHRLDAKGERIPNHEGSIGRTAGEWAERFITKIKECVPLGAAMVAADGRARAAGNHADLAWTDLASATHRIKDFGYAAAQPEEAPRAAE